MDHDLVRLAGASDHEATTALDKASLAIELVEVRRVTLVGRGRFDADAAAYLHDRLGRVIRARFQEVVLDLSAVTSIDAACLALIAAAATDAHRCGARMVVSGLPADGQPSVPAAMAASPDLVRVAD